MSVGRTTKDLPLERERERDCVCVCVRERERERGQGGKKKGRGMLLLRRPAIISTVALLVLLCGAAIGSVLQKKHNIGAVVVSASFMVPSTRHGCMIGRDKKHTTTTTTTPGGVLVHRPSFLAVAARAKPPNEEEEEDPLENSTSVNHSTTTTATTTTTTPITADTLTALEAIDIKKDIDSPVLQNVFPHMLRHVQQYGHPNIPLGTTAGRQCEILRRLHIQQKLSETDVALLEQIQFRFYSLEQVYQTANFEELLDRLEAYAVGSNNNDWSPPKKYAPDPELGAWVTGIRRMRRANNVDPVHVAALEERSNGQFEWQSPRKCGSQFMKQYRALQERLLLLSSSSNNNNKNDSNDSDSATVAAAASSTDNGIQNNVPHKVVVWNDQQIMMVWNDPAVQQWVRAQQDAAKRGTLSETRKHYMAELLRCSQGYDWIEQERPWEGASPSSSSSS